MENDILDESELIETEPITPDELITNLLQDLILDNSPVEIAREFIGNFVLQERDETPAILAMMDAPTEAILALLKQVVSQGYEAQIQALDTKGASFIEGLKIAVKTQLTELAQ